MKKKVSLIVNIPNPCTQSWNDMNPTEGGSFCLHCQKTVVDFSAMTDKEILAVISKRSGNLCGNFQSEQLNRTLVADAQPRHAFLPAAMLASLIATIIPGNSKAHEPVAAMEQMTTDPVPKENAPRLFKGQVIDSLTNEGLRGVTIALKRNVTIGAVTDAAGKFQFTIPSDVAALTFKISYLGYNTKEISFNVEQLSAPITISLQQSAADLKELVVYGVYTTKIRTTQTGAIAVIGETFIEKFPKRLTVWQRIARLFKKKEKCTQ